MSEPTETKLEAELPVGFHPPNWRQAALLVLGAAACFHTTYTPASSGPLALLVVGYVACLVRLARLKTTRQSFYAGLLTGLVCFAPQLECFWRIFGAGAIALWLVLALWIALFLSLTHLALARVGLKRGALLIPFLWTGLEYFRSELYYLKFSWLNGSLAFADVPFVPFGLLGNYGVSFAVAALAASLLLFRRRHLGQIRPAHVILFILLVPISLFLLIPTNSKLPRRSLVVAGVQMEFPDEKQMLQALDKIVATQLNLPLPGPGASTNVDLIVLSEYTLDGPPPERLKAWCRTNQKFLIVGGKDAAPGNSYYNTAFVISTNGEIVFKQVKSVPIQFFKDGLPAQEQKLWVSPWGKIGICICYDLSYTRVTDELVRQSAQMLIVPTMDLADWGRHQHELHARVALVRAAEYGIPIFRLASSGISQGISPWRRQNVTAPFSGEGAMIFFGPTISRPGSLPLDRWLAPFCVAVTGLFTAWLAIGGLRRKSTAEGSRNVNHIRIPPLPRHRVVARASRSCELKRTGETPVPRPTKLRTLRKLIESFFNESASRSGVGAPDFMELEWHRRAGKRGAGQCRDRRFRSRSVPRRGAGVPRHGWGWQGGGVTPSEIDIEQINHGFGWD